MKLIGKVETTFSRSMERQWLNSIGERAKRPRYVDLSDEMAVQANSE